MSNRENEEGDELQSIIAELLDAIARGEYVDRDAVRKRHGEYAESLNEFFANHDQVKAGTKEQDVTIAPVHASAEEATLPPTQSVAEDVTIAPSKQSGKSDPTVGDKVRYFGDYELLEEIARGGMGVVYKAKQVNLNRVVALKMILSGELAGEEDVQRFKSEAEAAAQLDHPGIVPIYEIGEHQGQHYFSMGFVDGKSLAELLSQQGPLDIKQAVQFLMDICRAVEYAHCKGVIHRDLKPANVLIEQSGTPRITDFGLAKRTEVESDLTRTGQILGTPAYMPPEQASGDAADIGASADIYSMGALLYALLVGHPPFQAANPLDTILQVLEQEPIALRKLNRRLPKDLETIVSKCLEKEPRRRYASCGDLADDLERFRNGDPIKARPVSIFNKTARISWKHRKELVIVASVALMISLLTFAGSAINRNHQMELAKQQTSAFFEAMQNRDPNMLESLMTQSAKSSSWGQVVLNMGRREGGPTPNTITVTGATVTGDEAAVTYTSMDDGQENLGTIHLIRENGVWYVNQYGQMEAMVQGVSKGLANFKSQVDQDKQEVSENLRRIFGTGFDGASSSEETPDSVDDERATVSKDPKLPQLPGAVTQPPNWISDKDPFDVASFFQAPPDDQNAEKLYLDALFEFSDGVAGCFVSDSEREGASVYRGSRATAARIRLHWLDDAMWPFLDDQSALWQDQEILTTREINAILSEYETGIQKLIAAQKIEKCVFQPSLLFPLTFHAYAARKAAYVLILRAHSGMRRNDSGKYNLAKSLESVQILLRLARDLQPRGEDTTQLECLRLEWDCIDYICKPLLAHSELKADHCQQLIEILAEHDALCIDSLMESEKCDYVELSEWLHRAQTGDLDAVALAEYHGINRHTIGGLFATQLVDLGIYHFNLDEVRDSLQERVDAMGDVPKQDDATKQLQSAWEMIDNAEGKSRRRLAKTAARICFSVTPLIMTGEDYEQELDLIRNRFQQVKEAWENQRFPEKLHRLHPLVEQWTRDDSYKNAKLLRLVNKVAILPKLLHKLELTRNAIKCLIAARHWQLLHQDIPGSLAEACAAVKLSEVPRDPFSGQALKMRTTDGKSVVYSVGPDEDDDEGRSIEGPLWRVYQSGTHLTHLEGDIVFAWQD